MDAVLRAAVIYGFLLVLFRIAGKRTLAEMTPFDFVLLLIIGEATQQGLLGNDFSVTNALLVVTSLVTLDIVLSLLKQRWHALAVAMDGEPVLLMDDGRLLDDRMRKARVDRGDILEAARSTQGLERLDQVKYAILERSGGISIVPRS